LKHRPHLGREHLVDVVRDKFRSPPLAAEGDLERQSLEWLMRDPLRDIGFHFDVEGLSGR
jgi:hypothetical protein